MRSSSMTLCLILGAALACVRAEGLEPEKRRAFSVPLANVTAYFDRGTGRLDEVFIHYGDLREGWAITEGNDRYVKNSRHGREDYTYVERPQSAYLLSNFEAQQISRVCETFAHTLKVLERDLQRERWDRCRYLDFSLSSFLHSFYYLVTAAYVGQDALPRRAMVADSMVAESFSSLRTDRRVDAWRADPQHLTQLRIAAKDLIYQIRQWQERELDKADRDPFRTYTETFGAAYELFVRYYCNVPVAVVRR